MQACMHARTHAHRYTDPFTNAGSGQGMGIMGTASVASETDCLSIAICPCSKKKMA